MSASEGHALPFLLWLLAELFGNCLSAATLDKPLLALLFSMRRICCLLIRQRRCRTAGAGGAAGRSERWGLVSDPVAW